MFETRLGDLVRTLAFMLKGKSAQVKKAVDSLFKVAHPDDILEGRTSEGRLIKERAEAQRKEYSRLIAAAKKKVSDDSVLLFLYPSTKTSFTVELANELIHAYPEKLVIVGREKGDEVKMSLRSAKLNIPKLLEKALVNVKGYGGGHDHACGGCVARDDFEVFVENIRGQL